MHNMLPTGFYARRPTPDDLKPTAEMVRASELAETGSEQTSDAELYTRWTLPGHELARDAWLVIAPGERIAGFLIVGHVEIMLMNARLRVHPDYAGLGLYTYLLELAIERGRELLPEAQKEARVALSCFCGESNDELSHVLEKMSFIHVRSDWLMQIDMDQPPPAPVWPTNIELRPYTPELLYAVFEAHNEAFRDHWGYVPRTFEVWQTWMVGREDFDPGLWFLALDGDEIAGFALCEYEMGEAWVGNLGVRRPWRREGLGLALLYQAFGEFYRRNARRVVLNVDSQNLTGATRLYARAGMHLVRQIKHYQFELRAGVELSTQQLDD